LYKETAPIRRETTTWEASSLKYAQNQKRLNKTRKKAGGNGAGNPNKHSAGGESRVFCVGARRKKLEPRCDSKTWEITRQLRARNNQGTKKHLMDSTISDTLSPRVTLDKTKKTINPKEPLSKHQKKKRNVEASGVTRASFSKENPTASRTRLPPFEPIGVIGEGGRRFMRSGPRIPTSSSLGRAWGRGPGRERAVGVGK